MYIYFSFHPELIPFDELKNETREDMIYNLSIAFQYVL